MNKFVKVLTFIGIGLFLFCFVSGCISSLHLDNLDWKTERVEYEYN